MERYLVELTGDQLDRLNGMVREAINAAEGANKGELEDKFGKNLGQLRAQCVRRAACRRCVALS